jgi:hypothetical protein
LFGAMRMTGRSAMATSLAIVRDYVASERRHRHGVPGW